MIPSRVIALGATLIAFGCTQPVGAPEDASEVDEALYLKGTPWPGGSVRVCFDGTDGNNPALVAETRRLVEDTWGRAANLTFFGWGGPCNYAAGVGGNINLIALHYCGATSTGVSCPLIAYDNNVRQPGTFRGMTPTKGTVKPKCKGNACAPGVTHVSIVSDDPDPFQTRFRYEVIHEFGHALAFAHEQDRPDNFDDAGTPLSCDDEAFETRGGTYETSFFDTESIMNYCASDPLTGDSPTMLSNGDTLGVRKVYGRKAASHGFMIKSDTNNGLAVNAFGGAAEGTVLRLHNACTITNPDCTWSYQRGMIVSDTDPSLAIIASGGATEGAVLKLTRTCTTGNPDCTWTYKNGEFLSDRNAALAINASGGARFGTTLVVTQACTATNPDCTWTLPNVMLANNRDVTLAVNALNGAVNGTALTLHNACDPSNPDCTWTFSKGMITSDRNSSLAMRPSGGARQLATIQLVNTCSTSSKDCTWTWTKGELISDNTANGTLPMNALGGGRHLATLALHSACTSDNPDCVFTGFFARN